MRVTSMTHIWSGKSRKIHTETQYGNYQEMSGEDAFEFATCYRAGVKERANAE